MYTIRTKSFNYEPTISSKVFYLILHKYSTVNQSFWSKVDFDFPVDLTANVNMIGKLVFPWDWNRGPPDL